MQESLFRDGSSARGDRIEARRCGLGPVVGEGQMIDHVATLPPFEPTPQLCTCAAKEAVSAEMYISAEMPHHGAMTDLTVTDARARLADVVDEARVRHTPVYLTRRGQRVAAIIGADDLDLLIEAAEDLADIEAAHAARAEVAAEGTIPWEQVKADLGIA